MFITLEGPEGSGKGTVIKHIKEKHPGFLFTREPGGVNIAEQIRNIILDVENTEMDERTEALLYAAARRQHLTQKVIPALNKGQVVVCDRFIDSSLAYQGCGRGLGLDNILKLNQFAIDGLMPDLTILLDVSPEVGLVRVNNNRKDKVDRLDQEDILFHNRVYRGYKILQERESRIVSVDASQSIEQVVSDVLKIIEEAILNDRN